MKKAYLLTLLISFLFAACEQTDLSKGTASDRTSATNLADQEELIRRYEEIQLIASSVSCQNAAQWAITPIGSKPCGGPAGYIAYPLIIDTQSFLQKVAQYTAAQKDYNIKTGAGSDCSLAQQPNAVVCVDGKAKLSFE